jgi:hypothetical protein
MPKPRDAVTKSQGTTAESAAADTGAFLAFLQDAPGQKLVAHMTGVEDAKALGGEKA